jgi:hypothetical protein
MSPNDELRDTIMSGSVREQDVRAFRDAVGEDEMHRLHRSERLVRESLQRASTMQTSDSFVARLQSRLEALPKQSPVFSLFLRWSMPIGILIFVVSLILVVQLVPHASSSGVFSESESVNLLSPEQYMRVVSDASASLFTLTSSTSMILVSICLAVVLSVWLSLPDSTNSGHHGRHNALHRSS